MTVCKCGNVLDKEGSVRVTMHPCRCKVRGPGRRRAPDLDPLSWVVEQQYDERTRLGLPIMTDFEKAAYSREV